MNRSKDHFP